MEILVQISTKELNTQGIPLAANQVEYSLLDRKTNLSGKAIPRNNQADNTGSHPLRQE